MEKQLIKQALGPDGQVNLKIVDSKLRLEASYSKDGYEGGVFFVIPPMKIAAAAIDQVEQLIPGDQTSEAQELKDLIAAKLAAP